MSMMIMEIMSYHW